MLKISLAKSEKFAENLLEETTHLKELLRMAESNPNPSSSPRKDGNVSEGSPSSKFKI